VNSTGLIPAQMAQQHRETGRAREGDFAEEPSGFWLTGDGFGHCFLESMSPPRTIPSPTAVHDDGERGEALASTCTGRMGQ
jgi:hypothetical protein